MPSLEGNIEWLNSTTTVIELTGHPTLVQFWAISCPVCKHNMPKLQQFITDYCEEGLALISIHMPRMEADMDLVRVAQAMQEIKLMGSCAIDNQHILGDRFHMTGLWPTYFLFDAKMRLRSRAAGSMGIKMAENSLKRLLLEGI